MTNNATASPQERERYTTYHSDKTFSLLDWAYKYVKEGTGGLFSFTSNGTTYTFVFDPYRPPTGHGEIFTYPPADYSKELAMVEQDAKVITVFTRDTFDSFIETFHLDGKPLNDILKSQTHPSQNYTSHHHPETYHSRKVQFGFEYNGCSYAVYPVSPQKTVVRLSTHGAPFKYLMPVGGSEGAEKTLIEFKPDEFPQFIKTFEIEGKTVEWVLDHQRSWKYKLTAEHFERVLTGFSFVFVYRKTPCFIYYLGQCDRPQAKYGGRYINLVTRIHYDVTPYAPITPGADHWVRHMPGYWGHEPTAQDIMIGPFKTDGELLDTVQIDGKTLREIFDTVYDDGEVLCGSFDG